MVSFWAMTALLLGSCISMLPHACSVTLVRIPNKKVLILSQGVYNLSSASVF